MSVVTLLGVQVLNNPAKFTDKYVFEITFECLEELHKDLEWKLTYVGSATSDQYDQELDTLSVGPIPVGVNKFVFEADAPDISRILDADLLGVTVILLTCTYDEREFVRVGYYVNNEYDSEELSADPPSKPLIERIRRNVLAEKPRVTRFAIKWDSDASAPAEFPPDQPEADMAPDDDEYGADEVDEDEEEVAEGAGEVLGEDAAMGDDNAEVSDDGSEDIEGESEDEFDEEEEEEEVNGDDAMDVDMTDSQSHPVASH